MSKLLNGNGNGGGQGASALAQKLAAKKPATAAKTEAAQVKDSSVLFRSAEGGEARGTLTHFNRQAATFEIYSHGEVWRTSESLADFQIMVQGRKIYSGPAVVRSVVEAGTKVVAEVALKAEGWADLDPLPALKQGGQLADEFRAFFQSSQGSHRIAPEFKVAVADMAAFFYDLQLWLSQVESGLAAVTGDSRTALELDILKSLEKPVIQMIDSLVEQFESLVVNLDREAHPVHYAYLRRQLHPLILISPFANRAFSKPLGYAGDYLMVDMMIRPPYEGDSLYAKMVNVWLCGQTPAQAHRNRVDYLEQRLIELANRGRRENRVMKSYNLGCGPAAEVQRFFGGSGDARYVDMTLVDFNGETLDHLRHILERLEEKSRHPLAYRLVKKSVQQILKTGMSSAKNKEENFYDYIYCAGLFDYLPDYVCRQLMTIFYDMLAPGGLLVATNATDVLNSSRPFRFSMEYMLDWHLIYRDKEQFAAVAPEQADRNHTRVVVEHTGANFFLEVRKPENG